ncbi:MAG: type II toxin-antitoxin system VapC family toxin [Methanomicrobia archaeon]|nr:type II toxin-antitoxin system VapC family toxin [Methanomicrobia archaeon]
MIVLDTSFLIDFFRGKEETLHVITDTDVATTVITYYEIFSGIFHKKAKKEEKFFRRFFSEVRILNLDTNSAEKSSEIMARLLRMGVSVNALDVIIAGISVAHGAEKIISNDRDFVEIAKIADLEVVIY